MPSRCSPKRPAPPRFNAAAADLAPIHSQGRDRRRRPRPRMRSTSGWIKTQLNDIHTTLAVFYAFLALSVIVSLISTPCFSFGCLDAFDVGWWGVVEVT